MFEQGWASRPGIVVSILGVMRLKTTKRPERGDSQPGLARCQPRVAVTHRRGDIPVQRRKALTKAGVSA